MFSTDYPKPQPDWARPELIEKYDRLKEVRSEVTKNLEELRNSKEIGSSLEASVTLSAEGNSYDDLLSLGAQLRDFLIVSQAHVEKGSPKVKVTRATGNKCPRCWKFDETIKPQSDDVCPICKEALR